MYARVATFQVSDPDAVVEMTDQVREAARGIVESLPGWQGAVQLFDRAGGKLVAINYFDSQDNMAAAEPTFEEMPQRFPQDFRDRIRQVAAGRQTVERFEVLSELRP